MAFAPQNASVVDAKLWTCGEQVVHAVISEGVGRVERSYWMSDAGWASYLAARKRAAKLARRGEWRRLFGRGTDLLPRDVKSMGAVVGVGAVIALLWDRSAGAVLEGTAGAAAARAVMMIIGKWKSPV